MSGGTSLIKQINKDSVHRITSGQVVVDLQAAVKELVENSLDAGATNIEVKFKNHGVASVEVTDNGSGIAEEDHDSVGLKHHTSKLSSFSDLSTVRTFGFRGEAISSLCALSESVIVCTTTAPPMGTVLELDVTGKIQKRSKTARQRGTTVTLTNLFAPLPVRRKELERNAKREHGKVLSLLNAYALGPCCTTGEGRPNGVRLTVSNQVDKGQKTVQIRTQGNQSNRSAVAALWGPKSLENIVDLDIEFGFELEKTVMKRLSAIGHDSEPERIPIRVKGLISKFAIGCGRTGTDRQFFYVNGRPCNLTKIQKAFNEVYRSFNVNQAPFIVANFNVPTESCDINVSPDKRTIFLHSEANLISALKVALENAFSQSRSTFAVGSSQKPLTQSLLPGSLAPSRKDRHVTPPGSETTTDTGLSGQPFANEPVTQPPLFVPSPSPPTQAQPSVSLVDNVLQEDTPMDLEYTSSPIPPVLSQSQPSTPSAPHNLNKRSRGVVLDTTQASWSPHKTKEKPTDSQPAQLSSPARPEMEEASTRKRLRFLSPPREGDEDDVMDTSIPPRSEGGPNQSTAKAAPSSSKPRAISGGGAGGGMRRSAAAPQTTKKTSKDAREGMRNLLANFVRKGSRVPVRPPSESEGEEEGGVMVVDEAPVELEGDNEEAQIEGGSGRKKKEKRAKKAEGPTWRDHAGENAQEPIEDDLETEEVTLSNICPDPRPTLVSLKDMVDHPEVVRRADGVDISMRCDLPKLREKWKRLEGLLKKADEQEQSIDVEVEGGDGVAVNAKKVSPAAGIINIDDDGEETASDALSRVIEKRDFEEMGIVGQFNLGFIVVRRRKGGSMPSWAPARARRDIKSQCQDSGIDDLFIVDQHAADEKYNFETLQQTTKIKSQQLFKPQPLELTAGDEQTAIENIDILRQNGFDVEVTQSPGDEEAGDEETFGPKLKLVAQPVSKSTTFDMKDLEELIHLMRDRSSGQAQQMVRCSKARAMFAMRACRKSVMVGMPLTKQQMSTVVKHMGTMDQPWNCPHGRPTMRHLFDLDQLTLVESKAATCGALEFDNLLRI